MRQKHKLAADLYRYFAPFIDSGHPVYVNIDHLSADIGAYEGLFRDALVPNLWFTLIGSKDPILIEVEICDQLDRVRLTQQQLTAWRTDGSGQHVPHYWISADLPYERFCWKHDDFLPRLDRSISSWKVVPLRRPRAWEFPSIAAIALHLLREAQPVAAGHAHQRASPAGSCR